MLNKLFFMSYLIVPHVACQTNRGEGGGDLTSPGDLCRESSTTSELLPSIYYLVLRVSLNTNKLIRLFLLLVIHDRKQK